jgi:DNA-binding MarR family transcriptional regulator
MTPTDAIQRAWVALQRAAPLLRERVDDRLKAEGLPDLADYSILWALDRAGGSVRPRDLGLLLFIPRYQVSRMIERLVGEGLVERQTCPRDRRGHLLALTAKGKATRLAAWAIYGPAMAEAMGGISDSEALILAELVNRLQGAQSVDPSAGDPGGDPVD